jgi:L-2,4-diaminobutyric acid acetyltransferase
MRPDAIDTLFIWQIAVSEDFRRLGVAAELLNLLTERVAEDRAQLFVEATVTSSNKSSHELFSNFAEARDLTLAPTPLFTESAFCDSGHEEELLYRIGPIIT